MTQTGTVLGTQGDTAAPAAPADDLPVPNEGGDKPTPTPAPDDSAPTPDTPPADPTPPTPPAEPGNKPTDKGGDQKTPAGDDDEGGEISLTLGEGAVMAQESLQAIADAATAKGLTQEQAQEMANQAENTAAAAVKGIHDEFLAEIEGWKTSVKEDAELGGENFDETKRLARTSLERFGSTKLMEELEATGYGDHPELIRFCRNIGKAMDDDGSMVSGAQTRSAKSRESKLYTNPTSTDDGSNSQG